MRSAQVVDSGFVEFEFIGQERHLKEKGFTRGAHCTSIDAVLIGEMEGVEDSPFSYKNPEAFYHEPFYQLMRQTLLGWQLTLHCDHGCTSYRHVHVVPEANRKLSENVTSPHLRAFGVTVSAACRNILRDPDLFLTVTPENLMAPLSGFDDFHSLEAYLRRRYWVPSRTT